jgi:hypothetical protein
MSLAKSKGAQALRDQSMIAGVQKHLAGFPSLTVGTENVPPATIVQTLQKRIDLAKATAAALAAYQAAVKAERGGLQATAEFSAALKRLVEGMYFGSPDMLADFGLKPVRRAKQKVAAKAAAVELGKSTRQARHTLGPKQKKAVTGQKPTTPSTPKA